MTAVFAGRRIDPEGEDVPPRFPVQAEPRVRREIERVLRARRPSAVVGSAACGSDLLVLEAAGALGIRRRIILPFARDLFRATSVTDRPGDWGPRFDAAVAAAAASGDVVELALDPDGADTYLRANEEIFRDALRLESGRDAGCMALVLWNLEPRGNGDVTEAFLNEARQRGWPTEEIDTRVTTPESIDR